MRRVLNFLVPECGACRRRIKPWEQVTRWRERPAHVRCATYRRTEV